MGIIMLQNMCVFHNRFENTSDTLSYKDYPIYIYASVPHVRRLSYYQQTLRVLSSVRAGGLNYTKVPSCTCCLCLFIL